MNFKYILSVLLILTLSFHQVYSQKTPKKIKVTGLVVDNKSTPVIGALMTIDGKSSNIRTDMTGRFRLRVPSSTTKIGVYVTFERIVEEEIKGRTEFDIIVTEDDHFRISETFNQGNEDVNVAYGTTKKRNLTDNVNKADTKDYHFENYSNIYEMIAGKIPGVKVDGSTIIIQGVNSINNTDPLLVVDGVIVGSIGDISPGMVKSIEVLKGASASIYGSRGANGVIMITLKQGRE